jgi:membrane protein implicated in regulation of membrane protease activity
MDVTGLIYVAIVALWAAVLIPMWLRRHDDDQARRIERHRVAMGTLARIADDAEVAQSAAARRRRVILAGAATVGALATAAWVAGLIPGVLTLVLWMPLVVFLPVAVIAERRAARLAAERALDERRERRVRRSATAVPDHVEAPVVRADAPTKRPRPAVPAWDEVFDQTA